MRRLLILGVLLLAGCAVRKTTITVPGCGITLAPIDGCDASRSYKVVFPDRVEYHCVWDMFVDGKKRTAERVEVYRCVETQIKGDEK